MRWTEGVVRRRCPDCGVDVKVRKPDLTINAETSRHARKEYGAAIRRQVMWEALCDGPEGCKAYFNALVRRIEEGGKSKKGAAQQGPSEPV
jgi:hypothetical protein